MGRYEEYFKTDREKVYGLWHKVVGRGHYQIILLAETINQFAKEEIKILDIGCGEGDEMMNALKKTNKKISIVANDTSKEAIDIYMNNNGEHVKKTCLEKLENLELNEKFDLIVLSHCLYGATLDNVFTKFFKILEEDGTMLIFQESIKSEIMYARKKFWPEIYGVEYDENTIENVKKELNKSQIPFQEKALTNYLDFEKINGEKQIREELIPFIFRKKELSEEFVDRAYEFIKTFIKDNKMINYSTALIIKK